MGVHILLNIYECTEEYLEKADLVKKICLDAAEFANLCVLKYNFHQFKPSGASGTLLLSESHLNIHTWPEYNSAAIDVFCCFLEEKFRDKALIKAENTCDYLIKKFGAKKFDKNVYFR